MENLIDGKAVAALVRAEVGERVRALQARTGVQCGLATVMVGDDPASAVYVGNKHRACHDAGMASFDIHLPADARPAVDHAPGRHPGRRGGAAGDADGRARA